MNHICETAQEIALPKMQKLISDNYYIDVFTGCWNWLGKIDRDGYGVVVVVIGDKRRATGAHRASWIVHRGLINDGLTIDHLCLNKKCINPNHLEPVTVRENVKRSWKHRDLTKAGRPREPLPFRKGCRVHGKTNGYFCKRRDGYTYWVCRPCRSERAAKYKL